MKIPPPINAPGVRLVCLNSTARFQQANTKPFRVKDAKGNELVDLAAIFDAENRQATAGPAPMRLKPLSSAGGRFRRADGSVDLAAIFNEEARLNGLTAR
jgi:hypothetical protein